MANQAWDRRRGETETAFAAFTVWLEMGPTRTLLGAARRCGKSDAILGRWAQLWDWRPRAAAYDVDGERASTGLAAAHPAADPAWLARLEEQLERDYRAGREMTDRAEELLQCPALREEVRELVEGTDRVQLTVREPLDVAGFRAAADLYERGRSVIWSAIKKALPPPRPGQPAAAGRGRPSAAAIAAVQERALKELDEWTSQKMLGLASEPDRPPGQPAAERPPGSAGGGAGTA